MAKEVIIAISIMAVFLIGIYILCDMYNNFKDNLKRHN